MRIGKREQAVLDRLDSALIKGVQNYATGESREVASLKRKGLITSYVNLENIHVLLRTEKPVE